MTFWKKHTPSTPVLAMTLGAMALMVGTAGCGTAQEIEPSSSAESEELPELNPDGSAPSERMTLEEAAPFLQAQGYLPAQGDLSGYEIGYLPDAVEGTPYDQDVNAWLVRDLGVEEEEAALPYDEEVERSWLPDTVDVDHLVDDDGNVLPEREVFTPSDLYVKVMRDESLTDVDSYLDSDEEGGITLEEALPGGDIQELPDGSGYYNGAGAVFVPEAGVVIEVLYMDDAVMEEWLENADGVVEGYPDEVLLIVEGIEPV